MFYCNECAEKKGYPITIGRSQGCCEFCGRHANCNDMPSSKLPPIGFDMNPQAPKLVDSRRILEIEVIAWQVFLRNTGLRFKRKLTSEEIKSITEVDTYEYYRQEAVKIYEKKQRALLNKKYPIIDVPADGKRGWGGGAYCLCFVYSKYNGNFVLSGYIREVEEYLKKNYTHYFYNKSLWYHGFNRDIWGFWKKDIGIFEPSRRKKKGSREKFEVRPYSSWFEEDVDTEEKNKMALKFKRIPKRWIPEFDIF